MLNYDNIITSIALGNVGLESFSYLDRMKPFNLRIMSVDEFIKDYGCMEVTSHGITEASTQNFHPQGLFSEEIFGQIGTDDRLKRFGFIRLNFKALHPQIYKAFIRLKRIYAGIINGVTYAMFDNELKDFIEMPRDEPAAKTGYTFFTDYIDQVLFDEGQSAERQFTVKLLKENKDNWYMNKCLVIPAGLRDIQTTGKAMADEDINVLYRAVLSYSKGIVPNTRNIIYDPIKANVVLKIYEVYKYIETIGRGKHGFFRGSIAKRNIAYGTANVISAASTAVETPNSPRALKWNENIVPLFQVLKAYQPKIVNYLKVSAFDAIFSTGSDQVALINPKTLKLEYVTVPNSVIEMYRTADGLDSVINAFKNVNHRYLPASVWSVDKKKYHMYLIYDDGDTIILFRNIDDFKNLYSKKYDKSKIRPCTWLELMYMVAYSATKEYHCGITRYPVGQGSDACYPSKVRLYSTSPNRLVRVTMPIDNGIFTEMPHYPLLDKPCQDSMSPFPGRIKPAAADFDGDREVCNGFMADDVNEQIHEYWTQWKSIITPQRTLSAGGSTDNTAITVFNLSRLPGED